MKEVKKSGYADNLANFDLTKEGGMNFGIGNLIDDVPKEIQEITWNGNKPLTPGGALVKIFWKPRNALEQKAPRWINGAELLSCYPELFIDYLWNKFPDKKCL